MGLTSCKKPPDRPKSKTDYIPINHNIQAKGFYDNINHEISLPIVMTFDTTLLIRPTTTGQYILRFYNSSRAWVGYKANSSLKFTGQDAFLNLMKSTLLMYFHAEETIFSEKKSIYMEINLPGEDDDLI